jgi:hypothetical protein
MRLGRTQEEEKPPRFSSLQQHAQIGDPFMRGGTGSSAEPRRGHSGLQRRARGGRQGQRRSAVHLRHLKGLRRRLPLAVGATEAATPVLAPTASHCSPASARLPSSTPSAEPCRPLLVAGPTHHGSPDLLSALPLPPDQTSSTAPPQVPAAPLRGLTSPSQSRSGAIPPGSASRSTATPPTGPPLRRQRLASVVRDDAFLHRGSAIRQNACLVCVSCWSAFSMPKIPRPMHFCVWVVLLEIV